MDGKVHSPAAALLYVTESDSGSIHKGRPHHQGGGGIVPKADIVREGAWILHCRSGQNADKGEGVNYPENVGDVLCGWSLIRNSA